MMEDNCKMFRRFFSLLFASIAFSLPAQHRYWNENTRLTPWRFPLISSEIIREDLNCDGKPDILRTMLFDSIPILWIDDDGDMSSNDWEGDTDNDCLLLDLNRDGIFAGPEDLSIDWIDTDHDGIADMQFLIYNGAANVRYQPDYQSDFICVIDRENDNILSFIDWNRILPRCWEHNGHANFYQDYHGNSLLLKMHSSSFRVSDLRYNCENPFIFYDFDNDRLTEMTVRLMDVPHVRPYPGTSENQHFKNADKEHDIIPSRNITWAAVSWDVDNDNAPGNEFDLDMTLYFGGKGFDYSGEVHPFENRRLVEADKYFYDPRWRQLNELIYPDEHVACNRIFRKGEWDHCWLVFDEDDDCNRWERVEMYYPYDLFKMGAGKGGVDSHKQSDAVGDRGEFDEDNSGGGKLYISPLDGRIHLYGAEWGVWRIDQNASYYQGYGGLYSERHPEKRLYEDPPSWATVKYTDTDRNGFFDRIEYDLDGDAVFEETMDLADCGKDESILYDPAEMEYHDVCSLFIAAAENTWKRAEETLATARKYGLNTSWYAFWLQPRSLHEKYAYGYWLNFYLYRDLKSCKAMGRCDWNKMDLSGIWSVKAGLIVASLQLPGSLSENGIGETVRDSITDRLTERFRFTGKAVYEREVDIPASWEGKTVELFMERTKVSEVFVNGISVGTQKSVSSPHIYYLKNCLQPGKNRIAIAVDNTKHLLPLGGSHAYSEHTQTNWNGILGDFYLRLPDNINIADMQVYADADGNCRVFIETANETGKTALKQEIIVRVHDSNNQQVADVKLTADIPPGRSEHRLSLKIDHPALWDEYDPNLYVIKADISGNGKKEAIFGFRDFTASARQFHLNGRTVFLRGTHEGGVFPLTGYPSMKKQEWMRYYAVLKSYGINHVRFHSWIPPRAAFEAADESGVFLQPELPLWGAYSPADTALFHYMKAEGEQIMRHYGNHPSFVMFALGNELVGDTVLMTQMVDAFKSLDKRRLYAMGSNNFYWNTKTCLAEDFFVSMRNGVEKHDFSTDLRGSFSFADSEGGGIINQQKPNTERNFSVAIAGLNKPVISHETGQYQVYPDYEEIEKYTGVLQARNFSVFRNRLEKAGMLSKSKSFLQASGALSALCYREEIEMALRTPEIGGFQLLDLKDYPGQGTALVGILNAFGESKNSIAREKWLEFCNDVVPLARFPKYCWTNTESFKVQIQIAHYGKNDLKDETVLCVLKDDNGNALYKKSFPNQTLQQGQVNRIAALTIPLNKITRPQRLNFSIELKNTAYRNTWNIWVYPSNNAEEIREGIIQGVQVTRSRNKYEAAKDRHLPVLYIPHQEDIVEQSVGGLFIPDFWNWSVFRKAAENINKNPSPGTLGILVDADHPLFDGFPTEYHANWQWWNIIRHSRPVILDAMPDEWFPLVQTIDNVDRNHKLGLIYEIPGSNALICTSDLFRCKEEPEVKALFQSMLNYLQNKTQ